MDPLCPPNMFVFFFATTYFVKHLDMVRGKEEELLHLE